ncbi:membrane fusion protein, multidrug efflux system [Terrimicrobium sacchariphilum]|uniref:Membrane fusion protein, multidrug efflux system n=1 Tax=Terrimicrobium sacchariphilum TaxID=690879 RepID=A0A146GEJ9_TERSA|nr:membrane fusion protein, multidrug efflux system [Terrimicrobium sacchariphilum]
MIKRGIVILLAVAAGIGVWVLLGGVKALQIKGMMAKYANMKMPPEAVTAIEAPEEEWVPAIRAVGSTSAVQGVVVSTDQPGIVEKIAFESGQNVKQGDLLVQLDVSQEQAQLRSAQAQLKLAETSLQRQKNLLQNRVSSQADFDAAQAQYDQAEARVQEVSSLINKKTIRAPFTGVLGIRLVNLGQYLQSGAQVAPLQSLDPIYVNFYLPQQTIGSIKAGQEVLVKADGLEDKIFHGKINAVDSVVDEATRNVLVQATLANPEGLLRPGMFVGAEVPLPNMEKRVLIPATAVQFAPYGDTVYVVEQMKDQKGESYTGVRQQVVKVGESKGDRVSILSGVKPGEQVVTSGVFKLRQGSHVQINNTIEPANNEKPKPEDS